MADHSKPTVTSTYANYTSELDGRLDDLALGLDPATTTPTNVPTNAIRWASASNKWQKWNGSSWGDLSGSYSININGTVGGTTPAAGTFTQVNFADNAKAIFGAGSDLQIYHDGAQSYITDSGTGDLRIQGTDIRLRNAGATATYMTAVDGAEVSLRYNDSIKLTTTNTGIDVTGTVVADGLTVDANTSSDAVRITQTGTGNAFVVEDSTSPDSSPFVIDATGRVLNGSTTSVSADDAGGTERTTWAFQANHTAVSGAGYLASYWADNNSGGGGLSLAKSRGATVGTRAIVQSGDELGQIGFVGDDGTNFISAAGIFAYVDGTPGTNDMPGRLVFSTTADGASSPTERMRITSAGNVGIGTSSPASRLHVSDSGAVADNCFTVSTPANDNVLLGANLVVDAAGTYTKPATSISGAGILFEGINALNAHGSIQFLSAPDDNTGSATPIERMRIDSSGNVGIGTSSPAGNLHLYDDGASLDIQTSVNTNYQKLRFKGSGGSVAGQISGLGGAAGVAFYQGTTEAARIDSSGNLLVGTTTNGRTNTNGTAIDSTGVVYQNHIAGAVSGTFFTRFSLAATQIGSISQSGTTGVAYNTSSDYRLKEDWQPMTGASERVKALKPVNFAWKADGSRVDGFLAHEAQAVVPEAVTGVKDAVDAEGNPEYQGIDQSKLVPLLTAALQEALAEINSLKARLDAANL